MTITPEKKPKELNKKNSKNVSYPRFTIKECIIVILKIREVTAANTIDKLLLAKSLSTTPGSSKFRMLIVSCNRYNLIEGNYNSEKISISTLGQKILDSKTTSSKRKAILESILNVTTFNEIVFKYDQKPLPSKDLFLDYIMKEFKIPEKDLELFYDILIQNLRDYSFVEDLGSKVYIYRNGAVLDETLKPKDEPEIEIFTEEMPEIYSRINPQDKSSQKPEQWTPKVFVSHSKNEKILEQIEKAIDTIQRIRQTEIEVRIAIKEETTAIPIPDKIFNSMRESNCAIINISADEENKINDDDYTINGNVLIEIGGAFLKYDKRVILLVDKRLENKIPSNLQGLYRCYYSGEELSGDVTLKLIEAMAQFFDSVQDNE